ncbi:MAG: sulfite exporter TauE/SafE family protein [bacterium]
MFVKLLGLLTTGFFLGMQHSLDPDHVAAVSTIVSKNTSLKKSALVGAVWGLGHTSILLLIGLVVMILKLSIPERLSQVLELLVGVMLLYLGLMLLKNVIGDELHIHKHKHGEIEHIHLHSHKGGPNHEHLHRPFFIGVVHGLAGSAGILLLIMASMPSLFQGLLFTLIFGMGSVLGMVLCGAIISLPFRFAQRFGRLNNSLMFLAAILTITIGIQVLQENWSVFYG